MQETKFIKPTTKVYRKQVMEGYSIPAFIKNGHHYYFVDLDVYEDGRVECWNFEDFEHFVKDVRNGWVTTAMSDKEQIAFHGLGHWVIEDGNWLFDKETFISYVQSLIKELNPKQENIYKYSEKTIGGIKVGENGRGTVYKEREKYPNDIYSEKVDGKSINLFYRISDQYYLAKVNIFTDGNIQLSRLENPVDLTFSEFEKAIQEKALLTELPADTTVFVHGLGNFRLAKAIYAINIEAKLLEVKDILRTLNGEPTSIDICREAYKNHVADPTTANRDKLKISYENVPDHDKMFVGDQDTKDIKIRMILYGEQEIEKWSHYQVAKSRGEQLPTIEIINPKDENKNE